MGIWQTLRRGLAAMIGPYGDQMEKLPTRPPIKEEVTAVRVRDTWSSYPSYKLTPEKLAAIWREADVGDIARQAELAAEIEEKEPEIASLLQTRKLAITKLSWHVQPASDSAEDTQIAAHVTKNLSDLKMRGVFFDLLDAIYKGFAIQWVHWALVDGKAWVTGLEWMPQHRCTFQPLNNLPDAPAVKMPRLLTEREPIRGEVVKDFTVLYHTSRARSGLVHRGGLWRPLSWYALFKNYTIKDWLTFLDRFGIPIPVGKYLAGAGDEDKKVLREAVQNFAAGMGVVISESTLIEILEGKSVTANSSLYKEAATFFDAAFAKVILGQTATTQGTPGMLGNEKERGEVREDIRDADAADLAETLTDQLVWAMVGFNWGFDKMLPQFSFIIDQPEDLEKTGKVDSILVNDLGLALPASYAYQKYGRPQPVGDEALLRPRQAPGLVPEDTATFAALTVKKKVPIGSRLVPLHE